MPGHVALNFARGLEKRLVDHQALTEISVKTAHRVASIDNFENIQAGKAIDYINEPAFPIDIEVITLNVFLLMTGSRNE
jgi:hypothetical protein